MGINTCYFLKYLNSWTWDSRQEGHWPPVRKCVSVQFHSCRGINHAETQVALLIFPLFVQCFAPENWSDSNQRFPKSPICLWSAAAKLHAQFALMLPSRSPAQVSGLTFPTEQLTLHAVALTFPIEQLTLHAVALTFPTEQLTLHAVALTFPTEQLTLHAVALTFPTKQLTLHAVALTFPTEQLTLHAVALTFPTEQLTLHAVALTFPTEQLTLHAVALTFPTEQLTLHAVALTFPTEQLTLHAVALTFPTEQLTMALCSSPCMLWQWAKSQCAHLSFLCYCQCTHLAIGTVSPENISLQASKSLECYVKIMLRLPVLSKMLNYNNVFIFIFYYWLFLICYS